MNALTPSVVTPRKVGGAALAGAFGLAWYALPDVVRCRTARVAAKTGLIAAFVAGEMAFNVRDEPVPTQAEADEVARRRTPENPLPEVDLSNPGVIAAGAALLAAGTALTVWGEKALFRRGERRRAEGVKWAHTRQAIPLAAAAAAAMLVPDPEATTNEGATKASR